MTSPRFVAHDHSDLLDLLPSLFGFKPTESIIAIATYGPRRRFGFRLRMDVPRCVDAEIAAELATRHLQNNGADGAILIAVTKQADSADAWMDHMHRLLGRIPVIDAVRTDGSTLWPVGPDGAGPPEPYIANCSPAVVEAVLKGMQILPSREALVKRFAAVTGPRVETMEDLTATALALIVKQMGATPAAELGPVGMSHIGPILSSYERGDRLEDEHVAIMAVWASSKAVRDLLWDTITRKTAVTSLELWTQVVQSTVAPYEPAVLCLAAFAAWLSGDGTQALIAALRATEIDPNYTMASLLLDTVQSGMSPKVWEDTVRCRAVA